MQYAVRCQPGPPANVGSLATHSAASHARPARQIPGHHPDHFTPLLQEQRAIGINKADTHVDFMIGTPTMDVDGVTADDRTIPIMRAGRFVADVA